MQIFLQILYQPEGTAIFKLAEDQDQVPSTGNFLSLDIDEGYRNVPSDWYLLLTGAASRIMKGANGDERNRGLGLLDSKASALTYEEVSRITSSYSLGDYCSRLGLANNIPNCSYNDLESSFYTPSPPHNESGCWELSDEVLRIPIQAVTNRDCTEKLGRGSNGFVHRAFIKLRDSTLCAVAVKTAKCQYPQRDESNISCLHSDAVRKNGQFQASCELMGALLYISSRKAHLELPGLLPTWGVIQNNSTILGTVMPVIDFKTLQDLWRIKGSLSESVLGVAKLMLPVAEALSFVEQIGFSFQDIHEKNIGISNDSAFAFDNTYLSMIEANSCGIACNFCSEELIVRHRRQEAFTTSMIRRKDCHRLLYIICETLKHSNPTLPLYNESLYAALDFKQYSGTECTMVDIAEILRNYIHERAEVGADRETHEKAYVQPQYPCYPKSQNSTKGFFFVKIPKTAGTTVA